MEHLSKLIVHFQNYFPEDDQQQKWIKDPFTTDLLSELTAIINNYIFIIK